MLTAKDFSTKTGISYPVIIRWLNEGLIPGAELTSFNVWQIPIEAVKKCSPPKRGRPKKENKKGEKDE